MPRSFLVKNRGQVDSLGGFASQMVEEEAEERGIGYRISAEGSGGSTF